MVISIKKKKYSFSEQLFFFIWTFYSCYYVLFSASNLGYQYSNIISWLSRYCSYLTIFMIIFLLFIHYSYNSTWRTRQFFLYVFIVFIVMLVELTRRDTSMLILFLFVFLGQIVDFDKLLRYDIKLKIFLLALIIGMCAMGILENRASDFMSGYKMSLGFSHPNIFACYVITILVEWLCIRFKKIRWFDWVAILVVLRLIVMISNARTSVYTFMAIFLLFLLAKYLPFIFQSQIVTIAFAASAPFMAFLSFLMVRLWSVGNEFAILLNEFLANRLRYANYAMESKGLKLFGQNINFSSRLNPVDNINYFLVDNAYIRTGLRWGIIVLCFILIMYIYFFIKAMKAKRYDLALMSLFFVIFGFGESYMINVFYNVSLMYVLNISDISTDMDSNLK